MTATEIVAAFLVGRHSVAQCPCRKRHHSAPKPEAPGAPPNCGKQARHLREALEALTEAETIDDEASVAKLARKVEVHMPGLEAYRAAYDSYRAAFASWSSEICGDCGSSLLCPTATCAYCLSGDAEALVGALKIIT